MSYVERDPELGPEPAKYSRAWYRQEMALTMALAMRGKIKRGVDWHDGDGLHTHVCGYDPTDPSREGCGHVWRHAIPPGMKDPRYYDTKKQLDEAHKCPHCGREHWTAKRLPGDPRLLAENYDEPEPKRGDDRGRGAGATRNDDGSRASNRSAARSRAKAARDWLGG